MYNVAEGNNNDNSGSRKKRDDNTHVSNASKRTRDDASTDVECNILTNANTDVEMSKKKNDTFPLPIWTPVPSAKTCALINYAQVTPPLPLQCKRGIVIFDGKNSVLTKNINKNANTQQLVKSCKDN